MTSIPAKRRGARTAPARTSAPAQPRPATEAQFNALLGTIQKARAETAPPVAVPAPRPLHELTVSEFHERVAESWGPKLTSSFAAQHPPVSLSQYIANAGQ